MSKPTPPHHKTVDVPRGYIMKVGYGGVRRVPSIDAGWWQIVAAASVHLTDDEKPPAEGYIRVIVAPARVPT